MVKVKNFRNLMGSKLILGYQVIQVLEYLGSGTYGEVVLAEDIESEQPYALKCVKRKTCELDIKLHGRVSSHSSIFTLHGVIYHKHFDILVLDFMENGDLYDYLFRHRDRPFTNPELSSLILQAVDAVAYLHTMGLAHRDIKLENMLVEVKEGDEGEDRVLTLRLADFGFATESLESRSFEWGTRGFMSPECETQGVGETTYSTLKNDVFGLGVALLILISGGHKPWRSTVNDPSFERYSKNPRSFLTCTFPSLTFDAINLLLSMLVINPTKRANMVEVVKIAGRITNWTRTKVEEEVSKSSDKSSKNGISNENDAALAVELQPVSSAQSSAFSSTAAERGSGERDFNPRKLEQRRLEQRTI